MNRLDMVLGSILLVCLGPFLMAGVATAQAPEKEMAAVASSEKWLALVDSGKYAESWTEAAGYFKNAVTQEQWAQSLRAVRGPLGKVISKEVIIQPRTETF